MSSNGGSGNTGGANGGLGGSGVGGTSAGSGAGSGAVSQGGTTLGGSAGIGVGGVGAVAGAGAFAGDGGGIPGGMAGTGATAGTGAMTNARFPFPQNQRLARCTYPSSANPETARTAYQRWKTEVVTSDGAGGHLRVKRPNSPGGETNSTVSEGVAYGMLIAVAMDDQPLFDSLWKYTQLWLNGHGLMHWYINAAGTMPLGTDGATDSDEDIAWALVMADRQWGGMGSVGTPYIDLARAQIDRIWQWEIDHTRQDLLLPGDGWGSNIVFNPSYFAPNQYRIFGQVTGKVAEWNRVIDTGYRILAASLNATSGNATNGLVPAWCDENGAPKSPNNGGATNYQYDSARTPFRIGQDYCYSGEPRAAAYLAKVSSFFAGVGAASIVDGYDLNGTPHPDPDSPMGSPQSAVFVGSAAVGAMHAATYGSFIGDAYGRVATGELLARSRYYNLSWTTLSLLMLTGNLVEYPAR
ncbi:MAG TPA: glycosyl hydrolase family 8 [Polyangiaceae bacterium]|nr:glycosyl hydrolase family 8 [Polyangiaceae bacterium]